MSGLEPIVAAVAPKAAASIVSTVVTRLLPRVLRSPLARWRTWRHVTRVVRVKVPFGQYDRWLRETAKARMQEPLESAGALLAEELDRALLTHRDWSGLADRRSIAVRLVEETYRAVLEHATPGDARLLRERWASARHAELIMSFARMSGNHALSISDQGSVLLAESRSRRENRLLGFRLEDAQVSNLIEAMAQPIPAVAPGTSRIITGAFGAGKSEVAESWFATAAHSFASGSGVVPIWLSAYELSLTSLTTVVRQRLNQHEGLLQVAIVIDGLDETDSAAATRIYNDVRTLVQTNNKSKVLLTARPGVLRPSEDDIPVQPLGDEQVTRIMEIVSGESSTVWQWTGDLRDAIRRPFFALAVAAARRDGAVVTGQASVIRHVVERALSESKSRKHIFESETIYRILENLAVSGISSASAEAGLSFEHRQRVLLSGLVEERAAAVSFTLPIFQQWFAAQVLLRSPSLVASAVDSAMSFDRWRWALAIACLAAGRDRMDALLVEVFRANPGAGTWLVRELAESTISSDDSHEIVSGMEIVPNEELAQVSSERRLVKAARAYVDGIGALSSIAFPVANRNGAIVLGARSDGRSTWVGWSTETDGDDRVIDLPDYKDFFADGSPWHPRLTNLHATGALWPWEHWRKESAERMQKVFPNASFGASNGVWAIERRQQLLREILKAQSLLIPPLSRAAAQEKVGMLLDRIGSNVDKTLVRLSPRLHATGLELLSLQGWLEDHAAPEIPHHLPTPDISQPTTGFVWGMYSDHQLSRVVRDTFALACDAYDEAAETTFESLRWYRATGEPRRFGVLAHLNQRDEDYDDWVGPTVTYVILPLDLLHEEVARGEMHFELSLNGRAGIALASDDASQKYLHRRMEVLWEKYPSGFYKDNPLRVQRITDSIIQHLGAVRPASLTALSWLWSDLEHCGWVSGRHLRLGRND